jgi:hypothetical protein
MANDIMEQELIALCNGKWKKGFPSGRGARKATIVIEHYLIQALDVSHTTMQHWYVYTKWNERLFQEIYKAYEGRFFDL